MDVCIQNKFWVQLNSEIFDVCALRQWFVIKIVLCTESILFPGFFDIKKEGVILTIDI